jgi:YggT family protein
VLANALIFLIGVAAGLFTIALLLRFYLQWARAPYRNPLAAFLAALTDFMVRPARRVVPGLWGFDMATLALAWLVQLAELVLVYQIRGYTSGSTAGSALAGFLLLALVMVVKYGLYIVMAAVVFQAVMSWVNPHTPLAPLLAAMTRPFLRPFQRLVPPLGGIDLSPLFVLVAGQLLLMLPVAYAEATASRLL